MVHMVQKAYLIPDQCMVNIVTVNRSLLIPTVLLKLFSIQYVELHKILHILVLNTTGIFRPEHMIQSSV